MKPAARERKSLPPEAEVNEILFAVLRAVYRFEQEKVAVFGLDYGAIYLLQYLRRHAAAPVSRVAEEMRLPLSTVSRLAGRLEKRGLIRRVQDGTDRRRTLVSLRARGKDLVRTVERHTFERLVANLTRVAPRSVAALVGAAELLPAVLEVDREEPAK